MKKENRIGQIRSGFKENPGRISSENDTCVMYVVKLPSVTNHCVELLYCNECGHTTPDTSSAYCPQCGRGGRVGNRQHVLLRRAQVRA